MTFSASILLISAFSDSLNCGELGKVPPELAALVFDISMRLRWPFHINLNCNSMSKSWWKTICTYGAARRSRPFISLLRGALSRHSRCDCISDMLISVDCEFKMDGNYEILRAFRRCLHCLLRFAVGGKFCCVIKRGMCLANCGWVYDLGGFYWWVVKGNGEGSHHDRRRFFEMSLRHSISCVVWATFVVQFELGAMFLFGVT